jgi:hypothetical protein
MITSLPVIACANCDATLVPLMHFGRVALCLACLAPYDVYRQAPVATNPAVERVVPPRSRPATTARRAGRPRPADLDRDRARKDARNQDRKDARAAARAERIAQVDQARARRRAAQPAGPVVVDQAAPAAEGTNSPEVQA